MNRVNYLPFLILSVMFLLLVSSAQEESAVVEEPAHIAAGFGYLQGDYRLNPQNPPLFKVLPALVAKIAVNPYFPLGTKAWQDYTNAEAEQGKNFLYKSGNNADQIIFWSRFPVMLTTVLLGWLILAWARRRFNTTTGLLALTLFAFSPTVLTHARYVTADVLAALGFFVGVVTFIAFLENPTWKNTLWAGLAFGFAQLTTFSALLLIPLYILLAIIRIICIPYADPRDRIKLGTPIFGKSLILFAVGLTAVYLVYTPLVSNYPKERQLQDAQFLLSAPDIGPIRDFTSTLISNNYSRPLAQYILGATMAGERSVSRSSPYLFDEIKPAAPLAYYPLLYLFKEPLSLHILTLIALFFSLSQLKKSPKNEPFFSRTRKWIHKYFAEFASLLFIGVYGGWALAYGQDLGIRHLLPILPFVYLLVSKKVTEWISFHDLTDPQDWFLWLRNIYQLYIKSIPRYLLISMLLLWLVGSTLNNYPNFSLYYNALAGEPKKGYLIAVESNYDWGQDLRRLRKYAEKNQIKKMQIDYYGGGDIGYYFGSRGDAWDAGRGMPPTGEWFAISATTRQRAFASLHTKPPAASEKTYAWLKKFVPIAKIGSIFVYQLP